MTRYERAVVLKRIDGLWREVYAKRLIREVKNDQSETRIHKFGSSQA